MVLIIAMMFVVLGCSNQAKTQKVIDESRGGIKSVYVGTTNIHLVQPAETLFSIAKKHNITWQKLAQLNDIGEPYTIHIGQRLRIAASEKKPVKINTSETTVSKKSKSGDGKSSQSPSKPLMAKSSGSRANSNNRDSTPIIFASTFPNNKSCQGRWVWPASGSVIRGFAAINMHNLKGIDIGGKSGSPVVAAADGLVSYVGAGFPGLGNSLVIKHNDACVSLYAHNQQILVQEGMTVKAGQKIAHMGNSGTDQVKLHFEILMNERPVDPLRYLPKR